MFFANFYLYIRFRYLNFFSIQEKHRALGVVPFHSTGTLANWIGKHHFSAEHMNQQKLEPHAAYVKLKEHFSASFHAVETLVDVLDDAKNVNV
jgi:hypothetical protein